MGTQPKLQDLLSDPDFQGLADPERVKVFSKLYGADFDALPEGEKIRAVRPQASPPPAPPLDLSQIPKAFGGTRESPPSFQEVMGQMYTGESEGLEAQAKGGLTAAAALPFLMHPVQTGLGIAGAGAFGHFGDWIGKGIGKPLGMEKEASEILGGLGVMGGGLLGGLGGPKVMGTIAETLPSRYGGSVVRALVKMLGIGEKKATEVAGQLSQAEAMAILRNMSKAAPGYVENPAVGEVAKKMIPALETGEGAVAKLAKDLAGGKTNLGKMSMDAATKLAQKIMGRPKPPPPPPFSFLPPPPPNAPVPIPQGASPEALTAEITRVLKADPSQIVHIQNEIGKASGEYRELLRKALRAAIDSIGGPPSPP